MWNTPTLPTWLLSQATITQSACIMKQSELQWLVMLTLPGKPTVLVTFRPSIHFLLKVAAVGETLDGFIDSLTLISFSFIGVYGKELNFYDSYFIYVEGFLLVLGLAVEVWLGLGLFSFVLVWLFFNCFFYLLCQKAVLRMVPVLSSWNKCSS